MPLDFAYRVHTDIGKNAHSFKINGKIVKANTKLKTGDVVEVITKSNIKPTTGWLERVISPFARNKIRQQLKMSKIPVSKRPNLQARKKKGSSN
jgi:GTP pyrophosphokinase